MSLWGFVGFAFADFEQALARDVPFDFDQTVRVGALALEQRTIGSVDDDPVPLIDQPDDGVAEDRPTTDAELQRRRFVAGDRQRDSFIRFSAA